MGESATLVDGVIDWLRANYADFIFYTERDIEWTIQNRLVAAIAATGASWRVMHNYRLSTAPNRLADLVIVGDDGTVEVAIELKYEPSHKRKGVDIPASKFTPTVVFWASESNSVLADMGRVDAYIAGNLARVAYAIFIDEGGYFRQRPIPNGAKWLDWDMPMGQVSVLSYKRETAPI